MTREKPSPEYHAILDSTGWHYIDEDYKNTGIDEGWLFRTGYTFDPDDFVVWTYVIV